VPSCLLFSVIIRSKICRTPHCRSRISIFTINCHVWSTVICHAVVSRFVRHFLQKVCFNFHCLIVVATEMKPRKSHHRQIASGAGRGHSHFEDKILGSSVLWIYFLGLYNFRALVCAFSNFFADSSCHQLSPIIRDDSIIFHLNWKGVRTKIAGAIQYKEKEKFMSGHHI
jgi:hypothetical protein